MTHDEMLIGWLCIFDLQLECDETVGYVFACPPQIRGELIEREWLDIQELKAEGRIRVSISRKGKSVVDLNGAEWGIATVPA